MKKQSTQNRFVRAVKKLLLSAFLITSFGAYALEHGAKAAEPAPTPAPVAMTNNGVPAETAGGGQTPSTPASATVEPTASMPPTAAPAAEGVQNSAPTSEPTPTNPPTAAPAPTSEPTATPTNGLKDGTYTGPSVDVQWGLVQVQATIRGGKLSDVQFLRYPSDRRTSQRINSQAMPWLQQEAIQAQSANVDLISGATLTSEGFAMSLQAALTQAQS